MATDYTADANTEAAYFMNEASGNLDDASSNNTAMAATGTPGTWNVTGKYGGAFDFTQQNNAGFSAADTAAMTNIRTLSVMAWTAPDTDGDAGAAIVNKWDGADGWQLKLITGAGPVNFSLRYQWTGGVGAWTTSTTPVVFDGTFQHLAVTYDAALTTNDPIFYYNGVSQSLTETNTPATAADDDTGGEPCIGILGDGSGTGTTGEYDGEIDEVMVYNGILTSTQINEIMNNGINGAQGPVIFNASVLTMSAALIGVAKNIDKRPDALTNSLSLQDGVKEVRRFADALTGALVLSPGITSPSSKSGGTFANDVGDLGSGTDWNNPSNAAASDNSKADVTLAATANSKYLKATNFGYAIPAEFTINGIMVEVERDTTVLDGTTDHAVRIVKGGNIGTTERKAVDNWPTSDAYKTYGSSSDLWGETWTPADINASNFGFAIAAVDSLLSTAEIDHIRVTVFFSSSVSATVNASVLTMTLNLQDIVRQISNNPTPLSVATSLQTITPQVILNPSALTLALALQAASPEVKKFPNALTASLSLQNIISQVSVNPAAQTISLTLNGVTFVITGDITINVSPLSMTATLIAPDKQVSITVGPQSLTTNLPSVAPEVRAILSELSLASILGGVTPQVSIAPANLALNLNLPSISLIIDNSLNATVNVSVLQMTLALIDLYKVDALSKHYKIFSQDKQSKLTSFINHIKTYSQDKQNKNISKINHNIFFTKSDDE